MLDCLWWQWVREDGSLATATTTGQGCIHEQSAVGAAGLVVISDIGTSARVPGCTPEGVRVKAGILDSHVI